MEHGYKWKNQKGVFEVLIYCAGYGTMIVMRIYCAGYGTMIVMRGYHIACLCAFDSQSQIIPRSGCYCAMFAIRAKRHESAIHLDTATTRQRTCSGELYATSYAFSICNWRRVSRVRVEHDEQTR